jgi:hypothetical protein
MVRVNFTGVEGQKTYEPLPAGKYVVEVTDFKEGTASENAKNAGAATISWELSVVDHDEYEGRKVWENMTIVDNSLWRLKAFLEAAGFEADDEVEFDPEDILGATLEVRLGVQKGRKNPKTGEEYDPRNVVKQFFPAKSE